MDGFSTTIQVALIPLESDTCQGFFIAHMEKTQLQVLYVIGGEAPPYKIGISSNVSKRLTAINTSCPFEVSLRFEGEATTDAAAIEAEVHRHLHRFRRSGEWFDCTEDDIMKAFDIVGVQGRWEEEYSVPDVAPSVDTPYEPSAIAFCAWLAEMQKPPFCLNEIECARLLGISANSVVKMKRNGADTRTALACRALLHRLEPWSA